jgi:hypothetical protein
MSIAVNAHAITPLIIPFNNLLLKLKVTKVTNRKYSALLDGLPPLVWY